MDLTQHPAHRPVPGVDRAFRICFWLTTVPAVLLLGLAGAMVVSANTSVSSTAALGYLFAFVIAVPVVLALVLALLGAAVHRARPGLGRGLAGAGLCVLGSLVLLMVVWMGLGVVA